MTDKSLDAPDKIGVGPMSLQDAEAILADVEMLGKSFAIGRMGDGYYIQIVYTEEDVITGEVAEQHGRKWYVSSWATRGEVVQTAFKAALTSAEHQVREWFRYKGEAIFGPHHDLDALVEICREGKVEYREP